MKHLSHLAGRETHGLEIGSYEGRSAIWLAENILTHERSTLACIDPWTNPEVESRFHLNTADYAPITPFKGCSHAVLRDDFSLDWFDFAYIDGDHEAMNVLEDAVHCFRLVKPGGVMIFDDYKWQDPKGWGVRLYPKLAVDAFLNIYEHRLEVLYRGYQVFVRRLS